MKHLLTFAILFLISFQTFAQTPEKFSYQAVIRNSDNTLMTIADVSLKIIIRQGSADGTNVYEETHNTTTNANALVTLQIGTGTVISGDFEAIDWSLGSYFTETQLDLSGGSNYDVVGVSQLLSVPYALHAKTAETIIGNSTTTANRAEIINFEVSRNITATDINNTIECTASATLTLSNNFAAMEIGDTINLEAHNGAVLTIQAASNASINYTTASDALFESEIGTVRFGLLRKIDDNAYIISGQ